MIYAKHATNIAITGQGTIDAQGGREFASWSQIEVSDRNRLRKMGEKLIPVTERIFGKGTTSLLHTIHGMFSHFSRRYHH